MAAVSSTSCLPLRSTAGAPSSPGGRAPLRRNGGAGLLLGLPGRCPTRTAAGLAVPTAGAQLLCVWDEAALGGRLWGPRGGGPSPDCHLGKAPQEQLPPPGA